MSIEKEYSELKSKVIERKWDFDDFMQIVYEEGREIKDNKNYFKRD